MLFGSAKPVIGRASGIIRRPPDEVFKFIGEDFFANYPRWSPEVIKLQQVAGEGIQVGSQIRQVRVDHGHKSESTFRVTDYHPSRKMAFSGVSNAYRCTYEFEEPAGQTGCTRLTFTFEFPELELMLRPFEKLVRVAVQDGAERTVRNIKGLLEKEAASV
jgi:hypothetical protein